eukprot:754995-Hanusia_phi.AAC.1
MDSGESIIPMKLLVKNVPFLQMQPSPSEAEGFLRAVKNILSSVDPQFQHVIENGQQVEIRRNQFPNCISGMACFGRSSGHYDVLGASTNRTICPTVKPGSIPGSCPTRNIVRI